LRVALLCLLLCACEKKPAIPALYRPDPATAAQLSVSIEWKGQAPPGRLLKMEAEPDCERLHPGGVREDRASSFFVYIKSGLEGRRFATPETPVLIEQKGCVFAPRVVGAQTGQTIAVKNLDPVSHSIHPEPKNNREWNQTQGPGAADLQRRFVRPEVLIPVKCNIHAWMKAWIAVVDHPWFATTKANDEAVQWKDLPPGRYIISAWHEELGERSVEIKLQARDQQTLGIRFD
jgi:plastocyanin